MKTLTVSFLRYLHYIILLFIIFGCLLPSPLMWKIHCIFIPLVIIQWKLNKGTCILTNLEHALRESSTESANVEKEQQQGRFIKSIIGICFNPLPSDKKIEIGTYLVMGFSAMVSVVRLFF